MTISYHVHTNFRLRRVLLMKIAQHSVATNVKKTTIRSDCFCPTGIFVESWLGL